MHIGQKDKSEREKENKSRRKFIRELAKLSAALAAVHVGQQVFPKDSKAQGLRRPAAGMDRSRLDRILSFKRRVFSDANFLRSYCRNPAATMRSYGLTVPPTGVPRGLNYDVAQFVVNRIKAQHGSYDRWAQAHGPLDRVVQAGMCVIGF